MQILSLEIINFRNLQQLTWSCSPGLNLIGGPNASGKTSLLEALYFLGRARSFRTRQARELIRHGETAFRLVATLSEGEAGQRVVVGVQCSSRELTLRIDGTPVHSLAQLARQVPVLLLNPNSHRLLEDGPHQRRRFMDWGLFHTDPAFWAAWKRYAAALRNRNAALRANSPNRAMDAWDQELVAAAVPLGQLRNTFCEALESVLRPLITETLGRVAPQVNYRPGWPQEGNQDLLELLRHKREQDRRLGYTQLGPQRADFKIRLEDGSGAEHLSRGQQKLLVIALILAQASLYRANRGSPCILLIDDLPAELDRIHRERVMHCLAGMESQLFVTAIESGLLDTVRWPGAQVLLLNQGGVLSAEGATPDPGAGDDMV
jgi:DNA replication and repair protein RecF